MHLHNRQVQTLQGCQDSPSLSVPCRTTLPSDEEYDFLIISDGSGHNDGAGGYGAVIVSTTHPALSYERAFGCATHTDTSRAEFMAILLALRSIVDHCDMEHSSKLELMQLQKPRVYILSDRQDLVGCIMIPTWSRKKNRDLWASFNWFSRYFDIKAAHIPRDTLHIHKQVDAIASNMRIVLKDFEKSQLESGNI